MTLAGDRVAPSHPLCTLLTLTLHVDVSQVTEYLHLFTALSPLLLHNYYKQSDQKLCGNLQHLLLLLEYCSKMEIQNTRYNLEKKYLKIYG